MKSAFFALAALLVTVCGAAAVTYVPATVTGTLLRQYTDANSAQRVQSIALNNTRLFAQYGLNSKIYRLVMASDGSAVLFVKYANASDSPVTVAQVAFPKGTLVDTRVHRMYADGDASSFGTGNIFDGGVGLAALRFTLNATNVKITGGAMLIHLQSPDPTGGPDYLIDLSVRPASSVNTQ